jgi:hypothetical protein
MSCGAKRSPAARFSQAPRDPVVRSLHDQLSRLLRDGAFGNAIPSHAEALVSEGKIDGLGYSRIRLDEALHGGDLAVDPGSEPLHEIPYGIGAHAHRHHDLDAAADMHASRESARALAHAYGERLARATSFE